MIRRTAAVTAASIAGVVLAGSAAVGANIGILDAADDTGLGTLSADAAIATPVDSDVTTTMPDTTPSPSAVTVLPIDDSAQQTFAVDVAGTVDIEADESGLEVKAVHANDGWTWQKTSRRHDAVTLTFSSGSDTLEFVASLAADGSIDARVDRPIVTSTSPRATPPAPYPAPSGGSTDDEYEDDHHDEDDDDDGDDDEHEGRDDDD